MNGNLTTLKKLKPVSAADYQLSRLRILAIGPAGSGKTTQLRTLPGKKLLF